MIKMFVSDFDYRKQLSMTVRESIVYRSEKRVGRYATQQQQFRMKESGRKIAELEKKLAEIDLDIAALQELSKWA
jgi:hypothetical protein